MIIRKGVHNMSAIALVLGTKFAILCGETMFIRDSGEKSTISKIKMVESSIYIHILF